MVSTLCQTQPRSNKHSNIEHLLRRRRTLGHEATVEYWGSITLWDKTKRGIYPWSSEIEDAQGSEIKGYHAVHWPAYLKERIGLKPVVKECPGGSLEARALRDYGTQDGTDRLKPWIQTQDTRSSIPLYEAKIISDFEYQPCKKCRPSFNWTF